MWESIGPRAITPPRGRRSSRRRSTSPRQGASSPRGPTRTIVVDGPESRQGRLHHHRVVVTGPITAVRLEALPDPSLNGGGPGPLGQRQHRADRGDARGRRGRRPRRVRARARWRRPRPTSARTASRSPTRSTASRRRAGRSTRRSASRTPPSSRRRRRSRRKGTTLRVDPRLRVAIRVRTSSASSASRPRPRATRTRRRRCPSAVAYGPGEEARVAIGCAIERRSAPIIARRSRPREDRSRRSSPRSRRSDSTLEAKVPTAMVMAERPRPRETFMLVRGQYDKRGEKVTADVPAFLPPLAKGAPKDRLALARWLVAPGHPLTSRVTVNRLWQMFFGTGTREDRRRLRLARGAAEPPRACSTGWPSSSSRKARSAVLDVKALVRLIVTSAAYRQSSAVTPELFAKDPENRLLARGAEVPAAGGVRPRPGPGRQRPARRADRRRERLAISAAGPVGGTDVSRPTARTGPRRRTCRATAATFTAGRCTPSGSGPHRRRR